MKSLLICRKSRNAFVDSCGKLLYDAFRLFRISALSADEQTFHESAPIYQNALRHSNFDHKLDYMKQAPQKNTQKQTSQYHLV